MLSEWALLPLRLFLGATFLFAGLQKLANPNFFKASQPASIQAQLLGSIRTSPVGSLLRPLLHAAVPIGYTIAFGEVAIGLGVLIGLWTRAAVISGLVLSFMLFLTVSFHASPYFTGADIVFFFAWMPFILAGGGSRLSLDGWLARRAAAREGFVPASFVPIAFASVQRMCGNFSEQDSTCRARQNRACDQAVCPVLIGAHAPVATSTALDTLDRRTLVLGAGAAAIVGAGAAIAGASTIEVGRLTNKSSAASSTNQLTLGTTTTSTPPTTTTTPPTTLKSVTPTTTPVTPTTAPVTTTSEPVTTTTAAKKLGTLLGSASQVKVGEPAVFTIPTTGDPGIIFQLSPGQFTAYDTVCPHMGCTVQFSPSADLMICPCHHSEFLVKNGDVISGPAPHGLTTLKVVEGSDGNLYLQ